MSDLARLFGALRIPAWPEILRLFQTPPDPIPTVPPEVHAAAVAAATPHELKLTDACVQMIEEDEGLRLKAYPDPASGGLPWTIGYGHTGPEVHPGLAISQAYAEELLRNDLKKFQAGVDDLLSDDAWGLTSPQQFSAMVSLAFNIGLGNFKKSSVLRFHNSGQYAQAADAFLLWNKASGKVMNGLVRRRQQEREMYLAGSK